MKKVRKGQRIAGLTMFVGGLFLMGYGISESRKQMKVADNNIKLMQQHMDIASRVHQEFMDECQRQQMHTFNQQVMEHQNMMVQQQMMMNNMF